MTTYGNERSKGGNLRARWIMKRAAAKGAGKEGKEGQGDVHVSILSHHITSHPIPSMYGSLHPICLYPLFSPLMMNLTSVFQRNVCSRLLKGRRRGGRGGGVGRVLVLSCLYRIGPLSVYKVGILSSYLMMNLFRSRLASIFNGRWSGVDVG